MELATTHVYGDHKNIGRWRLIIYRYSPLLWYTHIHKKKPENKQICNVISFRTQSSFKCFFIRLTVAYFYISLLTIKYDSDQANKKKSKKQTGNSNIVHRAITVIVRRVTN